MRRGDTTLNVITVLVIVAIIVLLVAVYKSDKAERAEMAQACDGYLKLARNGSDSMNARIACDKLISDYRTRGAIAAAAGAAAASAGAAAANSGRR